MLDELVPLAVVILFIGVFVFIECTTDWEWRCRKCKYWEKGNFSDFLIARCPRCRKH